jgi:transposase
VDTGFSLKEDHGMKNRRFTAEFKKDAARMMIIEGISVREVSEQLGVKASVLYRWKHEHLDELEQATPDGTRSPKAMAEEIAELRKQLAKSQRMNQILKKTVSYFSQEEQ